MMQARHSSIDVGLTTDLCCRGSVVFFCLVGVIRIFLGAASLPLFIDVDECQHFDLVVKYARGDWPATTGQAWDAETVRVSILYGTFEYLSPPEKFYGAFPPPAWILPTSQQQALIKRYESQMQGHVNYEAHSPPLYYLLAAAWLRLGELLGFTGPFAAYWVRFLNIPLYATLILVAYRFCRTYFSPTVTMAVSAMLAFFPSTTFFSVNSDVACPLTALVALWLLVRWQTDPVTIRSSFWTGMTVAAALLVKLTNVAILALCAAAILVTWFRVAQRRGRWAEYWPGICLTLSVAIPCGAWMLTNQFWLGDWTGTADKVEYLGWTVKPWGEFFLHPLFSPAGELAYWKRLCTSFYLGDMNWHGQSWADPIFLNLVAWLTFAMVPIGLTMGSSRRRSEGDEARAVVRRYCFAMIVGSIGFLLGLSLIYDFGGCIYPSRQYPYYNSGRLIYGGMVPILVLFAGGVESIGRRVGWLAALILIVAISTMLPPQIRLFEQVIQNPSNLFHLPMR
ncbi:DUF2142 domain-containing protein [Schlesneria paludicola]|uniref:DUF2142 domain-containing protein n=1 Tax=Schlesneria paludicola TaxID=360056 RepID=UPI0012FA4153|nr:DUF2142 domain-containing protein [Schlesneria paludicola]